MEFRKWLSIIAITLAIIALYASIIVGPHAGHRQVVFGYIKLSGDENINVISSRDNFDRFEVEGNTGIFARSGGEFNNIPSITLWKNGTKTVFNNVSKAYIDMMYSPK